jgi:hypothetical protein
MVYLTSGRPVEVGHPNIGLLVAELDQLDARNLRRDDIFRDKKLRVTVKRWPFPWTYNMHTRGMTHALLLQKVEILP